MWLLMKCSLPYWRICWLRLLIKSNTAGSGLLFVLGGLDFDRGSLDPARKGGLAAPLSGPIATLSDAKRSELSLSGV